MKILIDMNLPPKLADLLIDKGIEAVHWSKVGAIDAKDIEIMTYAHNNDYIVLTCDLDFNTILAVTHNLKPSVVQIRVQGFRSEQSIDLISSALLQSVIELEKGAILTIDTKKFRLRLLPL